MPKGKGSSGSKTVLIAYKDSEDIRKELMLLAAYQGHGKISWVVREAVTEYLKRHRKQLAKAG